MIFSAISATSRKAITMNEINADVIRNIISFLAENEQYGDDWGEEIAELDNIIDIVEGN